MRFTADLNDRGAYRKALHRAAQGGGREFERFIRRHAYLFAPAELTRFEKALDLHGHTNLARYTDHKFRSYRGEAHDPVIDGARYPTIIETLITPFRFLRHVYMESV